jgi:steroid delta-isomerase-like uncharacterized protein
MQLSNAQDARASEGLAVAQRYLDAWNRHDPSGIVACFDEGGTYKDPSVPVLEGPALAAYASDLFAGFPDLRFEIQSIAVTGEAVVVARWKACGKNTAPFAGYPPSGREIALEGVDFITLDDNKIQSVEGYFDQKTFFEQLGRKVIVAPHVGGFQDWGLSTWRRGNRPQKPGAFSITWIDARDEADMQRVADLSMQVNPQVAQLPGFISGMGVISDNRAFTITAWDKPESPSSLLREGAHHEAMQKFFSGELGMAVHTSVWSVHHLNALWVRCEACNKAARYDETDPICRCGASLPPPPPYY